MHTSRLSEMDREQIIRLYQANKSYAEIGKTVGCGMGTIANVVKAAGLPPRGKKGVRARVVEIMKENPTAEPAEVAAQLAVLEAPKARKASHKPRGEARKPTPAPKSPKARKRAQKGPQATKRRTGRGRRLPPVGTVIKKLDRDGHVRAVCQVKSDGIRYAGKTYKSLSGAAMAAMRALGLKSPTVNGFVWWGLV